MTTMTSLTAIILTLDEEANLPLCLESLKGVASEIIVVDAGSTDRTRDIASAAGAQVIEYPRARQDVTLNWALENVPMAGDWILRLDADERLTEALQVELPRRLREAQPDVSGFFFKRRVYFLGRWMRHGGYYPTWLLRVWRRGAARSEARAMDEHMVLLQGRPDYLQHDIWEENLKGLHVWTERQNRYATREAEVLLNPAAQGELQPTLRGTPEVRRRWWKVNVYQRAPLFLRAFLFWFYRYFVRLGFLDGRPGLIFHFLHGCWYRFLIDAKVYEARRVRAAREREETTR